MNTQDLVDRLRRLGAEPTDVEVKSATRGCPESVRETFSAFANLKGGTILLGLSDGDFQPVPIDADAVRDAVAGVAANDMTPPVRATIEIDLVDEKHRIVRVDVPELGPSEKPCYITTKGRYGGSFTRGGDGDRRLTHYEIDRILENLTQPQFDREPVTSATLDDLDPHLLDSYVTKMVERRPRSFRNLATEEIMRRLNIAVVVDGRLHPTMGAMLTFGTLPQQFFPQLNISIIVIPGTQLGDLGPNGERFLDNVTCDGPIPSMVADAIAAVTRNMTRAAIVTGVGREDRYDYPLEVVRELIVNAVMHRDYSPGARGAQIQVELYPDRLVVKSPGGFYGPVDPESFGEPDISSSRNSQLARFLEDVPAPKGGQMLAENRGSGIPTILRALNEAGMVPPEFQGDFRRVSVTVPHHALLTPEVLTWIQSLKEHSLSQPQIQALAVLRTGKPVRNQTLRGWGLHSADATRELSDLVRRGLIIKVGDRRGASYMLAPDLDVRSLNARARIILRLVETQKEAGTSQFIEAITAAGLPASRPTVINEVNELINAGRLEATAPQTSRHRRYRIPSQTPAFNDDPGRHE